MQSDAKCIMPKNSAVTVRLPIDLKRRLAARAEKERRSVSAQIVAELSHALESEAPPSGATRTPLGLFAGARLPRARDFDDIRKSIWGKLGARRG
jgi:plasmid stability protein